MEISQEHAQRVRNLVAEEGYEFTPDEIVNTLDDIFERIASSMTKRGSPMTSKEAREFLSKHRYQIYPNLIVKDAMKFFEFEQEDIENINLMPLDEAIKLLDDVAQEHFSMPIIEVLNAAR